MLNESTPPGLPDSRLGTEPTQPQLQSAAATFALLGSAPRLHLAWLMAHETSDVGTLARRVGLSIPTTSQHLAKLRLAGIVSARREGRHTARWPPTPRPTARPCHPGERHGLVAWTAYR